MPTTFKVTNLQVSMKKNHSFNIWLINKFSDQSLGILITGNFIRK